MNKLTLLYKHEFTLTIRKDISSNSINRENITRLELYINNTQFYFIHFMSLLSQLNDAVELLNTFEYNKKNINRGDHLSYNVENYMIRIISITDRLLQLINIVFYLQVDETKVNYKKIIGNSKIKGTLLEILYGELKQTINPYYNDRNSVVHRHSYINKELYRLQALYHPILTEKYIQKSSEQETKNLKYVRSMALRTFTEKTKKQFKQTNDACFEKLFDIFDILHQEYDLEKKKLKAIE